MLPDKPHDIRCRITNCRSALHTTIQHTVVPPYLFGSLGPRAFDALTSLTIGRCDISPNFLAELLSPTSPTRTQLKSLALDIDLDGHPDIEQGMWFVLGLYGLKCLGVSGEMDFEELQEDYPDQDILDFPRGRDGQPIEALKKRAEVDYLALKQLRPWVLNHHCLCPVVMHKHTSYPFDRLTHLEFGIFSEELSPEIPVIFGSNVFHHLKTLCLHGDAYYDAKSSISHFDYVVMLRSVSAYVHTFPMHALPPPDHPTRLSTVLPPQSSVVQSPSSSRPTRVKLPLSPTRQHGPPGSSFKC